MIICNHKKGMSNKMKKYIGDKAFYKMLLVLLIPMVIQQAVTSFVNLLDNIMVGRLGTESMSGVAIINQLMFVFNVTIFGCISGASIYSAQFFGSKNYDGVRHAFRFKLYLGIIIAAVATAVFAMFGDSLIKLYLSEGSEGGGDLLFTLSEARGYLKVMLWGLFPFMISQCYFTTLREAGETVIPMVASTLAILVNLTFNYLLIFGAFGFPKLGVVGAAIATVMSRYVEVGYTIFMTHKNKDRFIFTEKLYSSFHIPADIIKKIAITGSPLLINEILWSVGNAAITQNYSVRGLNVMAGLNISSTVSNLFMIVFFSMGGAISVLIGRELGAGNIEKAKDMDRKLIFFNVSIYVVIGALLASLAPFIPYIYKTEEVVRHLATQFLIVYAIAMPLFAFNHSTYFTMRAGGKTIITFLFDSVFVWVVSLPLSFALARHTSLNIIVVYLIIQFSESIKAVIGAFLLKSGIWAKNLINN